MEEEGSGQRGRWQWPVPEFEAASPPPPPTPPFSSPPSGAAKAQRGCLQGVHLCTSEHFLLHTCIERQAQISRVETHFFQASQGRFDCKAFKYKRPHCETSHRNAVSYSGSSMGTKHKRSKNSSALNLKFVTPAILSLHLKKTEKPLCQFIFESHMQHSEL